METMELSTLGRPVTLGDFYDYASDEISHLGKPLLCHMLLIVLNSNFLY